MINDTSNDQSIVQSLLPEAELTVDVELELEINTALPGVLEGSFATVQLDVVHKLGRVVPVDTGVP